MAVQHCFPPYSRSERHYNFPSGVHRCAGVWGIRVTSPTAASAQPFVGIVDCGASFSAVNWAAARLLGLLDSNGDLKGPRGPDVISLGG